MLRLWGLFNTFMFLWHPYGFCFDTVMFVLVPAWINNYKACDIYIYIHIYIYIWANPHSAIHHVWKNIIFLQLYSVVLALMSMNSQSFIVYCVISYYIYIYIIVYCIFHIISTAQYETT